MAYQQQQGRYHHLYNTGRWLRRRKQQLNQHPLCAFCLDRGMPVAANVVDHVQPHNGDQSKFYFGAVQSLCKSCHDKQKKIEEHHGYTVAYGPDGWPTDPRHPANRPPSRARP